MIWRPALMLLAVTLALLALAACDDEEDNGDATPPSSTPTPERTVESTPSDPQAIRELDLSEVPAVEQLLSQTNGIFVQDDVTYADLTGDGVEEAVVPASSSGTLGFLGFTVIKLENGGTEALRTETGAGTGMNVEVSGDTVIETRPVPGPDDPECCPSMLQRTTYSWDGEELVVSDEVTVPNPDIGGKLTPSAVSP